MTTSATKRWSIEHLPIIPERWRIKAQGRDRRAIQDRQAARRPGWQAGDRHRRADREGEMIAREMVELCSYCGPIQRLWLSALNDASIRKALDLRSSLAAKRCRCIFPHWPVRVPTG